MSDDISEPGEEGEFIEEERDKYPNGFGGFYYPDIDAEITLKDIESGKHGINDTTDNGSILHTLVRFSKHSDFKKMLEKGANHRCLNNVNMNVPNLISVYQEHYPDDRGNFKKTNNIYQNFIQVKTEDQVKSNGFEGKYYPKDCQITAEDVYSGIYGSSDTTQKGSVLHKLVLSGNELLFKAMLLGGANIFCVDQNQSDIPALLELLMNNYPEQKEKYTRMSRLVLRQVVEGDNNYLCK